MLKTLLRKLALASEAMAPKALPQYERRQLHAAVATLLHEAARVDLEESAKEMAAAKEAMGALFDLSAEESEGILTEARDKATQLISYFAPVSLIKRHFSLGERILLVEHIWRVTYADARLDPYEDHFARKIAHLLHIPNTQVILARNAARSAAN